MAIEIVDLPIKPWWFSIVFSMFTRGYRGSDSFDIWMIQPTPQLALVTGAPFTIRCPPGQCTAEHLEFCRSRRGMVGEWCMWVVVLCCLNVQALCLSQLLPKLWPRKLGFFGLKWEVPKWFHRFSKYNWKCFDVFRQDRVLLLGEIT